MSDRGQLLVIAPDATIRTVANTYDGIKAGVDGEWFDFVHASDVVGLYIQDEGMLNGAPLNVVASLLARVCIWGPAVLCHGHPNDEGDTLPPGPKVIKMAEFLADRWRKVLAYGTRVGQNLDVIPNPDTIPPPQILPLDKDMFEEALNRGETILSVAYEQGMTKDQIEFLRNLMGNQQGPSGGPPEQPDTKQGDEK